MHSSAFLSAFHLLGNSVFTTCHVLVESYGGTSMNKQKSALMEFIIIVVLLSCPVSRQYLTADHYFCLFRKWSSLVHPSVRLLVPVVDNQNRKPGQSRASVLYKPCREQRMPPQQILCWRRKLLHCTQSRHNILFK